jgi:hypothetical protein
MLKRVSEAFTLQMLKVSSERITSSRIMISRGHAPQFHAETALYHILYPFNVNTDINTNNIQCILSACLLRGNLRSSNDKVGSGENYSIPQLGESCEYEIFYLINKK